MTAEALPLQARLERLVQVGQPGARGVTVSSPRLLTGGNARQAWAFDATWSDADGDQRCECVLLARVGPGQVEASLRGEFDTLQALQGTGLPAPRPLWIDETGSVLGMPGFAMQRGHGRGSLAELLRPGSTLSVPQVRELVRQLVGLGAKLHALDWRALRPAPEGGVVPGHAALQVLAQWESQFLRRRLEPLPALASVFGWLRRHPPGSDVALVHGDFRLGNFLHDGERITLLLDWEMAHLGHPLEDIAWAYRQDWSPQHVVSLDECVGWYEQASGRPVDRGALQWWRIFSEVKFAVISLTAARLFADGASDNLRLAARASMVAACVRSCFDGIEELERR